MIEIVKIIIFLIAVIDPVGTIPVYLEATKHFDDKIKRKIAIRACIIAGSVLLFFILLGQYVLDYMSISISAFEISGGVILFLFALTMIFGEGKPEEEKHLIKDYKHVTTFPIAIPSIASPAAILGVVIHTDNNKYTLLEQFTTTMCMFLVIGITFVMLLMAKNIQNRIGEAGTTIISKIMGLLLASYAIQNILTGIKEYFF
jgi:multiple antibiotic resistance protein